jgi:hypothetical protein
MLTLGPTVERVAVITDVHANLAALVPGLVDEFGIRLSDEEIRRIADEILDRYAEVPIRSFVMTLANRRAREILKQRSGHNGGRLLGVDPAKRRPPSGRAPSDGAGGHAYPC